MFFVLILKNKVEMCSWRGCEIYTKKGIRAWVLGHAKAGSPKPPVQHISIVLVMVTAVTCLNSYFELSRSKECWDILYFLIPCQSLLLVSTWSEPRCHLANLIFRPCVWFFLFSSQLWRFQLVLSTFRFVRKIIKFGLKGVPLVCLGSYSDQLHNF